MITEKTFMQEWVGDVLLDLSAMFADKHSDWEHYCRGIYVAATVNMTLSRGVLFSVTELIIKLCTPIPCPVDRDDSVPLTLTPETTKSSMLDFVGCLGS